MATFCVNIKGKEFKSICEKYSDINQIELEYAIKEWMDTTNQMWTESNMDSVEEYIRKKFNIDTVRIINDDSNLKEIGKFYENYGNINDISKERALELYNEIINITDESNVSLYMNSNGLWNIRMKMPVNKQGYSQEMLDIKNQSIKDGTFMKAPNGNPTNLTERQWLQVRTKNFINWFGDWINDPANASKVVDENGEPLVVYHHTDNPNLTEFSTGFENYFSKDGGTKEAIFFDENETGTLNRKYDIPVFLNIRELNEYNETKQQLHDRGTTYREVVNQSAEQNNKDGGVHMKDFDDNRMEHQSIWIVHNPNQIKSATYNVGTFSPETDDIRLQQAVTDSSIVKNNIETNNEIETILRQLYPEIELNYTTSEITKADLVDGIEGFKRLHPDVITKARKMSLEEAMKVLKHSNKKTLEYQLGKGDRLQYEERLGKIRDTFVDFESNTFKPEFTKEDVALFKYLDTIQEKKHQSAVFNWYYNGIVNIFEDKYKIDRAIELATKHKLNLKDFESPMEVINKYGDVESNESAEEWLAKYDSYTEHLSNKTEIGDYIVYDVNGDVSTGAFISENIISKFYDRSPWCIFTFSKSNGHYSYQGEYYWNNYNALPRRIAFNKLTGKPERMFATSGQPTWWDENDRPSEELKMSDNMLSKLGYDRVNFNTISKGSRKNNDYYEYRLINPEGEIKDSNLKKVLYEKRVGGKLHKRVDYIGHIQVISTYDSNGDTTYIKSVKIEGDVKTFNKNINTDKAVRKMLQDIDVNKQSLRNEFEYKYQQYLYWLDHLESVNSTIDGLYKLLEQIKLSYESIDATDYLKMYKTYNNYLIKNYKSLIHNYGLYSRLLGYVEGNKKTDINEFLKESTKYKSLAQFKGHFEIAIIRSINGLLTIKNNEIANIAKRKPALHAIYLSLTNENFYKQLAEQKRQYDEQKIKNIEEIPIDEEDIELPFQQSDLRILGVSDLKALSVLIDSVHQKADTLPHEYAHHYINWFRNSKLVQRGIRAFGSEESLVQAVGEQTVKQRGKAYNWWKRFTHWVLNLFNRNQRLLEQLTNSFLTRTTLQEIKSNEKIENEINNINYQIANPNQLDLFDQETNQTNEKQEEKQQKEDIKKLQKTFNTNATPVVNKISNPIKKQFDNLSHPDLKVEGNTFPLRERLHHAKTLVNYASVTITEWMQQTPDFVNTEFEDYGLSTKINPETDFSKMNRKQFIESIGLNNILLYIKERYFNPVYQDLNEALSEKLQIVYDNFNAICLMANKDMILCEGFTIEARFGGVGVSYNSETDTVQFDFESEAQEIGETNAWGIRAKSISANSSLSQYIKRKLRTTAVKDNNGDIVTDEYGYGHNVYYDPDATTTLLYDKCSGETTFSGMVKALERESLKFSNLRGVIELIQNDKEFADKFFSNFFKDQNKFYTVAKVWDEERKTMVFTLMPINTSGFDKDYKKHIDNAIYRNEFRLLPVNKNGKIEYTDAKKAYDTLNSLYEKGKKLQEENTALFNQHVKERTDYVNQILKMMGIDDMFDSSVIEKLAEDKKDFSAFHKAIGSIIDVYERTSITDNVKILDIENATVANEGEFRMQNSTRFMSALNSIKNVLSGYATIRIEPYVYEGGKSYYAYSNPSFIGTLKKIMRNPEAREKYIREEMETRFMFQYEEEDGIRKRKWFNDVMSYLDTEDSTNEDFDHQVLLTFDREDYTNMGTQAFETCCILNYFYDKNGKTAWYKIPIYGDKPTFEFLKMRKKPYHRRGETVKNDEFLDSFYWNTVQECIRINTVLRRYYRKDIESVKNWDIKRVKELEGKLGTSFDELTFKQFQEVFPDIRNSGAAFHFFPIINNIITGDIPNMSSETLKRLQYNLFQMIKGEPVDNDSWFMDNIKSVIEEWMYNLEDFEIINMNRHGLFEFESEKRQKPDGSGSYYVPKPVFLEGLLFVKDNKSYKTLKYKDYSKNHLKYNKINSRIDKIIKQSSEGNKSLNDILGDDTLEHLAKYGIIKYENGKALFTEQYRNSTNTLLYELVKKDMLITIVNNVREYVWGNYYGHINIIQLAVTDPAYFKDVIDFQKRFAMVHSPGIKPNIEAKLENGKPVTDGRMRVLTLKDNTVKSAYINDIETIFREAAAQHPVDSPAYEYYTTLANNVDKMFDNINQTDAQAYSSPTAMMKELRMYGDWDTQKEAAYQAIIAGSQDISTMKQLFTVIKPFVGGTTLQSTFVGNENEKGSMATMRTAVQNKNSKYMILLADALARASNGTYGFVLQGIHDFMESTHFNSDIHNYDTYSVDGIDCLQFESAVKVGQSGLIDLNSCNNAKEVVDKLNDYVYIRFEDGTEQYNPNYVTDFSFDITSHQQEVPNHMRDHEQLDGSQKRALLPADQDLNGTITLHTGEENTGEAIKEYKKLVAAQIDANAKELLGDLLIDKEAFMHKLTPIVNAANNEKTEEAAVNKFNSMLNGRIKHIGETLRKKISYAYKKGVNASDMKFEISDADKTETFSLFLQDSVKNDAKYDSDTLIGLLVDENGNFTIPVADVLQSKKLQQITYALIKNRINKLKRKGGPAVQVSSYGIGKKLKIVWKKDKNGKECIDYMECYMSVPSTELEKRLTIEEMTYDPKTGEPTGKTTRLMDPEEAIAKGVITEDDLRAIGHRIPTEDTYSIIPMRIVGFLPKAGDAIMLPAEHVAITGSDFDIDKFYIEFRESPRIPNTNFIVNQFKEEISKLDIEEEGKKLIVKQFKEKLPKIFNNVSFSITDKNHIDLFKKVGFELDDKIGIGSLNFVVRLFKKAESDPSLKKKLYKDADIDTYEGRANRIFDLEYALLQTRESTEKMFNQGNFKDLIDLSKEAAEISGETNFLNIFTQQTDSYLYEQNTAAKIMIGICANNSTAHAFLQPFELNCKLDCGFLYNGKAITELTLDIQRGENGKLVSKTVGSTVGAAADAAKEPVFRNLNLTPKTMPVAMFLWRTGFSEKFTTWLMCNPVIKDIVETYEKESSYKNISFNTVIRNKFKEMGYNNIKQIKGHVKSVLSGYNFIESGMKNHCITQEKTDADATLCLFYNLLAPAEELNELTYITKINSITNAAGPDFAETYEMQMRMLTFLDNCTHIGKENVKKVLREDPILHAFYSNTIGEAGDALSGQEKDGVIKQVFENYYPQYSPAFKKVLGMYTKMASTRPNADVIDKLYSFYMTYNATAEHEYNGNLIEKVFDGTFDGRTDMKSEKTLNEFMDYMSKHKDNEFLKLFGVKEKDSKCEVNTLESDVNGASSDYIDIIKSDWAELLDKEGNATLQKMLQYFIFRSGFRYNPKLPLHLANADVKIALSNYIDFLNAMIGYSNISDETCLSIIIQFMRNNTGNTNIVPELRAKALASNDIVMKTVDGGITLYGPTANMRQIVNIPADGTPVFIPVVKIDGTIYINDPDSSGISYDGKHVFASYSKTTSLGVQGYFVEADSSTLEPKTVFGNSIGDNEKTENNDDVYTGGGIVTLQTLENLISDVHNPESEGWTLETWNDVYNKLKKIADESQLNDSEKQRAKEIAEKIKNEKLC